VSTRWKTVPAAAAGSDQEGEYSDTCTADGDDPEQDAA
jgi:hypothetical protein